MTDVGDHETLTVPDDVASRRDGTETVLMDVERGRYFALEGAAGRMWELLSADGGCSVGQMIASLEDEFDVERSVLDHDVRTTVRALVDRGLLRVA